MKKYAKITTLLLLVCLLCLAFCACIENKNDTQGNMTLVLLRPSGEAQEFSVDLAEIPSGDNTATGLIAVLEYLKVNEKLTYTAENSLYGAYLTKVEDMVASDAKRTFIALYTDVEDDFSAEANPFTIEYKGKIYTTSKEGASTMTIKENCTVIITLGTY